MKAIAKSVLNNGLWIPTVSQSWQSIDRWLGLSAVTQRKWAARLPAVTAAGMILAGYAWFSGLRPIDVRWALGLGLVVVILSRYCED